MNLKKSFQLLCILAIFSLLLLLVGCIQNKMPLDTNQYLELLPLEIGNYWIYESTSFFANDTIIECWKYGINSKVYIPFQSENIEVYYWSYISCNTGISADIKYYYKNETDGLYVYGAECSTDTLIFKTMYLRFPVKIGERWNHRDIVILHSPNPINDRFVLGDTIQIECVSTSSDFLTPAGKFNCYVYKYQNPLTPDKEKSLFYSPNIGLVGIIEKENNQIVQRWALKEYQIL